MKKTVLMLLLFVATFNLTAQTNLVPNGDMENWDSWDTNPKDWFMYFNGLWEKSSVFQNGSASIQMEVDAGQTLTYIFTPKMQFTSGVTYECTFYYKVVSGNVTKVEFDLYHTPSVWPESLVNNEFTDLSTTEWKKGKFEFTASATEKVEAYIYVKGDAGSKTLIDNVSIYDKATLSTSDFISETNKFNVYPNPSKNYIQVSGFETLEQYVIYNVLGKEISKGQISKEGQIDISTLTNGVYLLKTEKGKVSKFIKG